jgi:hypothetical protein
VTRRSSGRRRLTGPPDVEDQGADDSRRPPDAPLIFDPGFAAGGAIVLGVLACILLAPLAYRLYNTDSPNPLDRAAILTSLALLILGVLMLLLGAYAALLEVRSRLGPAVKRQAATRTARDQASGDVSLIGAIGNLKSLVLVLLLVGCVPLVAAAWVAQSRVDGESAAVATATPRSATRTPSPGSSATTAPTP